MEFVRVTKNAWGQEVLVGAAWEPLPWLIGAAIVFIVTHAVYKMLR